MKKPFSKKLQACLICLFLIIAAALIYYKAFYTTSKIILLDDANGEIALPFSEFQIEQPVYYNGESYYINFEKEAYLINKPNGAFVYMSPDGNDLNDGLSADAPFKTLSKALQTPHIQTIYCLEGVYSRGTNFDADQTIAQDINLIGVGNVVFDNIDNSLPVKFTQNTYCENIHFIHGANTIKAQLEENCTAVFQNCIFSESDTLNGLSVEGGSVLL